MTFNAYYPYAEESKTADTRNQSDKKSFDYLWASAKGKKSAPGVTFAFDHKMAKIVITMKCGNEVSFEELKEASLSLSGFKYKGMFDTSDGSISLDDDTDEYTFANNPASDNARNASKTENPGSNTVTYTMILFPQIFSASLPFNATTADGRTFKAQVDFTPANAKVDSNSARNEWVEGRQYNLSITLNKTSLAVDGCTIKPWTVVDGGEISAD